MNRRKFLGLLGGASLSGLSGCVDTIQDTVSSGTPGQRRIKEVRGDPSPVEFDISFEIDVTNRESTPNQPMSLSVTLQNLAESDQIIRNANNKAFSSQKSEDGTLLLVQPTFWDEQDIKSDRCWKMKQEKPIISTESESIYNPDEKESETYNLIATSDSSSCITPGEYRFENFYEVVVGETGDRRVNGSFRWGFVVVIEQIQRSETTYS